MLMAMMIPASDQAMKILNSYRRSRRVSREQALEELLARAEKVLSFEVQLEREKDLILERKLLESRT
jgi:hypothetical protein